MTLNEMRAQIDAIRAVAGDDEKAHSLEDDLREDFLRWLAEAPRDPEIVQQLSQLALTTEEIGFCRWCA